MQALGLLLAALVQTAAPQASDIVVTGERPTREAIQEFVREVGKEADGGQLARWEGPVCPFVTGLNQAHNRYVAETITAVATAIGAEAGGAHCTTNLVVITTDDPGGVVGELRHRQPLLFDSLDPPERRRLLEATDAARSWSVLATRGSDGRLTQRQTFGSGGIGPAKTLGNPDTQYLYGVLPSRILRSTRIDLATTFIVLDAGQIEGLTLQQVSGYVAMLALAQVETRRRIEPDLSILNLFHDRTAPPDDLTQWDIAYLRALYATDHARSAAAQRGQMGRMMREALAAPEED